MSRHKHHGRKHSKKCQQSHAFSSNMIHQKPKISEPNSISSSIDFNKLIEEEELNLIQSELENAEEKTLYAENALNYYKDCLDHADKKMKLINKLPRSPSKESLKQFALLQAFLNKNYDFFYEAVEKERRMINTMHQLLDSEVNHLKKKLNKDNTDIINNTIDIEHKD